VRIDTLDVRLWQQPDGAWVGPFPTRTVKRDASDSTSETLKEPGEDRVKKIKVKTESKGMEYQIQNVDIQNVNISLERIGKDGQSRKYALENLSLTCPRFSLKEPFEIALKGRLRVNDVAADISFTPKATLKNGAISLEPSPLKLSQEGRPLLQIQVGLEIDPRTDLGSATVKILPTEKAFCGMVASATGWNLQNATLSGDLQLALAKGEIKGIKGEVRAKRLNLADYLPGNLPEMDCRLYLDGTLGKNDSMQLTSCTVLARSTANAPESLLDFSASGPISWGKKPGAQLHLRAAELPLRPYYSLMKIEPAANAPVLSLRNLDTQLAVNAEQVQLTSFAAEIVGGKLAAKSFQSSFSAVPFLRWEGLEIQNVDVDSVLSNFLPKYEGQLTGRAHIATTGAAHGFTEDAMREGLRGSLMASITSGTLQHIPLLNELASATKIPDLQTMPFKRFDSEFVAGDENIIIKTCNLTGSEEKVQTTGTCEYDGVLKMPLNLALGGKLKDYAQREKIAKLLQSDADGYLVFPTAFLVTGTLKKPKIKLNLSKEEVAQTAANILQQLDKKESKKTKKEKDAPTEKKEKLNLLDLFKKK
jgi:hypothetical protein